MKQLLDRFNGYVVSEGTLKTEDLLQSFYEFISLFSSDAELEDGRWNELKMDVEAILDRMVDREFRNDKDREEASYLVNETMCDILNEMAPDGHCFGASEGDGALFGFWYS